MQSAVSDWCNSERKKADIGKSDACVCDVWSVCVLQLQIQQQGQVPQPDMEDTGNESEDEIDAALTDLQVSLEGSAVSATGDITRTPELHGYIRFFKYALMTSLSKC